MNEALGWLSSAILLFTLIAQVHKQWRHSESRGVSVWLFIGQMAASLGFLVYSVRIDNKIFIVTNTLTSIAAAFGLWLTLHHRRKHRRLSLESQAAGQAAH